MAIIWTLKTNDNECTSKYYLIYFNSIIVFSVGLGTVAGHLSADPDAVVIWVDAHADINTMHRYTMLLSGWMRMLIKYYAQVYYVIWVDFHADKYCDLNPSFCSLKIK